MVRSWTHMLGSRSNSDTCARTPGSPASSRARDARGGARGLETLTRLGGEQEREVAASPFSAHLGLAGAQLDGHLLERAHHVRLAQAPSGLQRGGSAGKRGSACPMHLAWSFIAHCTKAFGHPCSGLPQRAPLLPARCLVPSYAWRRVQPPLNSLHRPPPDPTPLARAALPAPRAS